MKKILDVEGKPYNKCFACGHLKTPRCNGPRTSSMELPRWCEYMRDLRDLFGLTNEYIAEEADASLKTVNKIMSCKADQDIMRDTARRIENVILGTNGNAACYLAFEEETTPDNQKLSQAMLELERALKDNADKDKDIDEYRVALDGIQDSYNQELAIIRDEAQRKIQFLLLEVEHLREEVKYLREENIRKGKLVDMYMPIVMGVIQKQGD